MNATQCCDRCLKGYDRPASVNGPRDAALLFRGLKRRRTECLRVALLNARNVVIQVVTVSVGSLNTTRTHPREILRSAIVKDAVSIILAHNHPSGSARPSSDDIDFTRTIKRACELMGISLLDHVVIAGGKGSTWTSLKEEGLL